MHGHRKIEVWRHLEGMISRFSVFECGNVFLADITRNCANAGGDSVGFRPDLKDCLEGR